MAQIILLIHRDGILLGVSHPYQTLIIIQADAEGGIELLAVFF